MDFSTETIEAQDIGTILIKFWKKRTVKPNEQYLLKCCSGLRIE